MRIVFHSIPSSEIHFHSVIYISSIPSPYADCQHKCSRWSFCVLSGQNFSVLSIFVRNIVSISLVMRKDQETIMILALPAQITCCYRYNATISDNLLPYQFARLMRLPSFFTIFLTYNPTHFYFYISVQCICVSNSFPFSSYAFAHFT